MDYGFRPFKVSLVGHSGGLLCVVLQNSSKRGTPKNCGPLICESTGSIQSTISAFNTSCTCVCVCVGT
jgi:hypothetical protein